MFRGPLDHLEYGFTLNTAQNAAEKIRRANVFFISRHVQSISDQSVNFELFITKFSDERSRSETWPRHCDCYVARFSNSAPKQYIVPQTELQYNDTIQYFDEIDSYTQMLLFLQTTRQSGGSVWASSLKDGRIKDSSQGKRLDGTPNLLPCLDIMKHFLRRSR